MACYWTTMEYFWSAFGLVWSTFGLLWISTFGVLCGVLLEYIWSAFGLPWISAFGMLSDYRGDSFSTFGLSSHLC